MKTVTKEEIINEIQCINEKFINEVPNKTLSRDIYRAKTKYKKKYLSFFPTFTDFKKVALGTEDTILILEKNNQILHDTIKQLKSDKKKLFKKHNIDDIILKRYENEISKFKFNVKVNPIQLPKETDKESILVLSDWHIGEVIVAEEVNFVNEFNSDILKARLDNILSQFVKRCQENKITNIHIILIGDLMSGGIHRELERNSEFNESESLFFLQKLISEKLIALAEHFSKINVTLLDGNHSRILAGRPYFKERVSMSWEYILGRQLKLQFESLQRDMKQPKIIVDVPESPFVIKEVNGRKFLITHGDILSGGGSGGFAGIAYYSLSSSSAKFLGALSQIGLKKEMAFNDIIIGHLHSTASVSLFNGGQMFINGCLIGTNEFSLYKMKSIAKIEQTMLILNKSGRVIDNIVLYGKDID